MILHYLLVVLVVLFGNFQKSFAEIESLPAHNGTFANKPTKVKLENDYSVGKDTTQVKSLDDQATPHTMKVTDLHDPLNIIDRINKTDMNHSHSITSEDFAQVTSLLNMTFNENIRSNIDSPQRDANEDKDSLSFHIVPVQDLPVDEYKMIQNQPVNNVTTDGELVIYSVHEVQVGTLDITELTSNSEDNINNTSNNDSVLSVIPQHQFGVNYDGNNTCSEPYESLNFTDMVRKVKDEIKKHSNDAVIAWEDIKERVSFDNEVSHALNDYHDKIKISQAANRSECVQEHANKYEDRNKFLKGVMQSCESQLQREQWHELQNRTKDVLNAINEIVRETDLAKDNLQKGNCVNHESIKSIENEGNRKLMFLSMDSKKQALLDLKSSALTTDEDEYRDCIIHNAGHEIVVDTLNDIMKIKNNCVG